MTGPNACREERSNKTGRKQLTRTDPSKRPRSSSFHPYLILFTIHFPSQISLSFLVIHTISLLLMMISTDIQLTPPAIRQSIYNKAIIDLRHTVGIEYVAWMEDTAARVSLVISSSWLNLSFRCLINSLH